MVKDFALIKTLIKQNTINDTDKPKLYTKKIYVKKLSPLHCS